MNTRKHPVLYRAPQPLAGAVSCAIALAIFAAMTARRRARRAPVSRKSYVTAQKREENVQDIPATVNAVTASQIADFRVVSLDDVQALTPGVLMVRNDARRQSVTIRGITADPDNNAAAADLVLLERAPLRSQQAFTTFFDIERLEVLRGRRARCRGAPTRPARS